MRAIILINAYSGPEHSLYQSGRLKEELEKRGVAADIRRNNFFAASLGDGGEVLSRLSGYDFCIYLDKDKYISRLLEKTGMRLFNPHAAVEACDDKMTTAICLSDAGIPMPKTLPGLLCYDPSERIADETLDTVAAELGFPLIVKTSYGSLGKGVAKAEDREALRTLAEQVKCMPHLFQRCISSSYGRDIRAIVIGGKYVAAMERRARRSPRDVRKGSAAPAPRLLRRRRALRRAGVLSLRSQFQRLFPRLRGGHGDQRRPPLYRTYPLRHGGTHMK